MADIEKLDLSMAGKRGDDAVLPCPFCGSKNITYGRYEHAAGRRYAIVCMNCMAQIDPGWAQSWGAVQELWNRRADGWISVKERLPENDHTVLFSTKYDGIRMGSYLTTEWKTTSYIQFSVNAVTHWMPLPSTGGLNDET